MIDLVVRWASLRVCTVYFPTHCPQSIGELEYLIPFIENHDMSGAIS